MLPSHLLKSMAVCTLLSALPLSAFDLDSYKSFLDLNQSLSKEEIVSRAEPVSSYYSSINSSTPSYLFLDSIQAKYKLTPDELDLLQKNSFVVTERQSFTTFGLALRDIFHKDLPVFLTTDAILYTLHLSYDEILAEIEKTYLQPSIKKIIEQMRDKLISLKNKYENNVNLAENFKDVDLYLTIASSLIDSTKKAPLIASSEGFDSIWNAIQDEKYVEMALFSTRSRKLDFSQFTVRGHYITHKLGKYFKTMMWLGRTEFMLTSPKQGEENLAAVKDMQRMTIDAILLTEILEASGTNSQLAKVDSILSFIVGESDNCTPDELGTTMKKLGLNNAKDMIDINNYNKLANTLSETPEAGQKILSQVVIIDPSNPDSLKLPVSFLLLGQRFIVDSYILGNVIYDKIIHNKQRIKRLMPDPLDAMYALGNADAAPLLEKELQQWHYAPQLEKMRYLVNSYENTFWNNSLYNIWLSALRALNPVNYPEISKQPLFMRTTAWHQQKLNTQLASWSQLRHDNLLYAKQSYTPGDVCSYPHGYVEPYPEFYRTIGTFARNASQTFKPYNDRASKFYNNVSLLMDTLNNIAQKELDHHQFTYSDSLFLSRMLVVQEMCGAPIVDGWFGKLFYDVFKAEELDFTIADVHTQPIDEVGNMVGNVLHVGVGKINIGVFLAESPSAKFAPMAYVGPASSYYQTITSNFKRLTDQEWDTVVNPPKNATPIIGLPQRPDWINSYCTDINGKIRSKGRVLKGIPFVTGITIPEKKLGNTNTIKYSIYQGNGLTNIKMNLQGESAIKIDIFDTMGRIAAKQINRTFNKGSHVLSISLRPGAYSVVITSGNFKNTIPLLVIQ